MDFNQVSWLHPSTWPHVFLFWLAAFCINGAVVLWKFLKRRREAAWPVVIGRIESAETKVSSISSSTSLTLTYSYSAEGPQRTGQFSKNFSSRATADDFARDLRGRAVDVSYDPTRPEKSTLTLAALTELASARDAAESPDGIAMPRIVLPEILVYIVKPVMYLAAIGYILSLSINIAAITHRGLPDFAPFLLMHVGIFVVFVPSVFIGHARAQNGDPDFWKKVLDGAPDAVRYLLYAQFAYSFLAFLVLPHNVPNNGDSENPPWAQFSCVWMVFYLASFAICLAAVNTLAKMPHCLNGHTMLPSESFCARCGQPRLPPGRT